MNEQRLHELLQDRERCLFKLNQLSESPHVVERWGDNNHVKMYYDKLHHINEQIKMHYWATSPDWANVAMTEIKPVPKFEPTFPIVKTCLTLLTNIRVVILGNILKRIVKL